MARSGDMDQASPVGEAEVHSDGDQSTDTDEEGVEGTMLTDKESPIPQISFEADKSTGNFPSPTYILKKLPPYVSSTNKHKFKFCSYIFSETKTLWFNNTQPLTCLSEVSQSLNANGF